MLRPKNLVGLDFETDGLYRSVYADYTKPIGSRILNPDSAYKYFGHMDTTQAGFYESYKSNIVKHITVNMVNKRPDSIITGPAHKRLINGVETEAYLTQTHTVDDVIAFISKPGSKLKGAKAEWYVNQGLASQYAEDSVGTVHRAIAADGREMWLSHFALKDQISTGELSRKPGQASKLENLIKSKYNGKIGFERATYSEWRGTGKNSLYRHVSEWLGKASKENPLTIAAWNPYFDINFMLAMLKKYGHDDLARSFYKATQNGTIMVEETEKLWKAVVFKLIQENPSLATEFRISTNPAAAMATGRPGQLAHTFEEMEHAIPWKAESASKLMGIKGSEQLHAAGPDVFNEMKLLRQELVKVIEKAGFTSAEDLIKADTKGMISKVLELNQQSKGLSLDSFTKELRALKKRADLMSKYPGMFEAGAATRRAESLLSRWGGLGAAVSIAMFATYAKSEGDIYPFSKRTIFGRPKDNKTARYKSYYEQEPNVTTRIASDLGLGIGGPLAYLYAVGRYTRSRNPKLLGANRKPVEADNMFAYAKAYTMDALEDIKYGIYRMESSFPTTRLTGFGSLINFLGGNSKNSTTEEFIDETTGLIKQDIVKTGKRPYTFKTVENGRLVGRYNHQFAGEAFLEAAQEVVSNSDYEQLAEIFNPQKTVKGAKTTVVKIISVKGKGTLVYAEDLDKDGIRLAKNASKFNSMKPILVPVEGHVSSLRLQNIRHVNAEMRPAQGQGSERILGDTFKNYASSMDIGFEQAYQVGSGQVSKISKQEFISRAELPGYLKNKPQWQGLWKWMQGMKYDLEMAPKGIGEAHNSLYPQLPRSIAKTKAHFVVTGVTDNPAASAKYMYRNFKTVAQDYLLKRMNTFFESPFELLVLGGANRVDALANKLNKSNNIIAGLGGRALQFINRPHLGLTMYDIKHTGMLGYAAKFGTKRLLPAYLAWNAFQFADHLLGKATFSPTGQGPMHTGIIKAYESASLIYNKISDLTGLTYLAKKQEKVAPGSTGLGIFAPGLSMVSTFYVGKMAYKYGPPSIREAMNNMGKRVTQTAFMQRALRPEAYKGALAKTPLERLAYTARHSPYKAIFGLSMLPMLPFLPGFLGSNKSYAERKAEYKGDKEVAIRKYRGWLLSSSPYAGGKPIQFRRHMLNLVENDYENKGVIWPSYWSRAVHNLSFGLLNRYKLEEYHAKDQPVYESAPYGANVPFIGQLIAKTIGPFVKPIREYHQMSETERPLDFSPSPYALSPSVTSSTIDVNQAGTMRLAQSIGIQSENSSGALYQKWSRQYHDLIGFTGFAFETLKENFTGKYSSNEFTPYKQSATEMYNPAQQMWGWRLGDITGVGGEFLRRIFPYPSQNWSINNLPNELSGVSWIPQGDAGNAFQKYNMNLTHGTTFDKVPMGWLMASKKGWEFQFPEIKGKSLEEYPDAIRLEILQSIAPFSDEFKRTSEKVVNQALNNKLELDDEQRYYETLDQVRQLKDQYVTESNYSYSVDTQKINGVVSSIGDDGRFTIEGDQKQYRLAGVSTADTDIRADLLKKEQFDTAAELAARVAEIKTNTSKLIQSKLSVGSSIEMDIATPDNLPDAEHGIEAMVGGLNEDLLGSGAVFKNTGSIANFNMQQDQAGLSGTMMGKLWSGLTDDDTFWNKKLIPQRDYLNNYLQNQVFNREVKLWSHPIKHLLEPFISSAMHRFGIDRVPSFTVQRRSNQEYWDIMKYVKYKTLAVKASQEGNYSAAYEYHQMWRNTMIGANPTADNVRQVIAALPQNERPYFRRFANEPNPHKREEIYKFLPRAARRLYNSIWTRKEAAISRDAETQREWQNLQETEGWGMTKLEEKMYERETGGSASKADWIRAKYVEDYIRKHPMPGPSSLVWSPDVDIDNIELLALRDKGEQIQDYGFFEDRARMAAFDAPANAAAIEINSLGHTARMATEQILAYTIQNDNITDGYTSPTSSDNPIQNVNITTDRHDQFLAKNRWRYGELIEELFKIRF